MVNAAEIGADAKAQWSAQDEQRLARFCAASMTVAQLATRLDRTEVEIIAKLRELRLHAGRFRHAAIAAKSGGPVKNARR
jgi:hypothetical protein